MSKFSVPLLFIAGILCSADNAISATTNINLDGKITTTACTVETKLANGLNINLGKTLYTSMQNSGDVGIWNDFSLNLTSCPKGTNKSTMTLSGIVDNDDSSLFINTATGESAATNVAVQLANQLNRSQTLSNNSQLTVTIINNQASFPLSARISTPSGGVTPGLVKSTVLVNFTYQ